MLHRFKKTVLVRITVILCALTLSACHRNPLLSDESITKMKQGLLWIYGVDKEVDLCSAYYANPALNPAIKARCDRWLSDLYKKFINEGTISYKATWEDFSDPSVWKILKQT